jgi:hypothetical protein
MWLDIVPLPNAVNNRPRNPELRGQHSHSPVRAAVTGSGLHRGVDDLLLKLRRQDPAGTLSPANARDRSDSVLFEGLPKCQNGWS